MRRIYQLVLLVFSLEAGLLAQQTVNTEGGSTNHLAKFSGSTTLSDSVISEENGKVGIGVSTPAEALQVNGQILLTGQDTHQIQIQGVASTGRLGQDSMGTFLSSDSLGSTLRFLTNNGFLNSWMNINSDGKVTISNNENGMDFGEVTFSQDSSDIVSSVIGQAGPQMHLRVSRAYCDKRTGSTQSSWDQQNYFCVQDAVVIDDAHPPSSTPNKDFLIVPYKFGMALEYPGVLEAWNSDFSVHTNHRSCSDTDNWIQQGACSAGAHLWIGDIHDAGGVFASAYDVLPSGSDSIDRSHSFVLIASDTFNHASHGDMLLALRDPQDNFRFQFGPSGTGQADDPATFKQFTKARIDSTGKGFFDGGTQTDGADFAESVLTAGTKDNYEPGDVLVIDTTNDRRFAHSSVPYSTLVAGIYSTTPGVVATLHTSEDTQLMTEIPMAVVGIVPCKVSTENGPISRGDLLVTSSTPGYAMRGTETTKMPGAIIGKALQSLQTGKAKIEILVSLQ